jgi:SPP1 gp7 family putative phage head morphogenesis protein
VYNVDLISSLNDLESDLDNILIQKDKNRYRKLLNQLNLILLNASTKAQRSALKIALDYLLKQVPGEANFTEKHAKIVNKILKQELGKDDVELASTIGVTIRNIYKLGISDTLKPAGIKLAFDLKDNKAAAVLTKHTMFWTRHYYSDFLNKKMDEFMTEYFTADKPIKEVARELQTRYKSVSVKNTWEYFKGLAEFTTNRVRELGKVTGFEKGHITSFTIVAKVDERTSKICRKLNGTIVPVKNAIKFRDTIISLKSPEDIKDFAPWLSPDQVDALDTSNLPPGASLPPFHWKCRTQAIANFT